MIDDGGNATAFRINHKYLPVDATATIAFETLYKEYIACGDRKLSIVVTPTIGVTKDSQCHVAMSKVAATLDLATKLYPLATNVACMNGPKSHIADATIKKGEPTLVPTTRKMKVAAAGATLGFACRVDGVVVELKSFADTGMLVPAWFCNSSIDKKDVNLKFNTLTVVIDSGVDADAAKHCKSKSIVDIQILVNTRALKVGDELQYSSMKQEIATSVKRPFDII